MCPVQSRATKVAEPGAAARGYDHSRINDLVEASDPGYLAHVLSNRERRKIKSLIVGDTCFSNGVRC